MKAPILKNIIYLLNDPINNLPFYIGKSTTGLNRPFVHIKNESHSDIVNNWVEDLKKIGQMPIIVILESTDQESLLDAKEEFWIKKYIDFGYVLLNKTLITPFKKDNIQLVENCIMKDVRQFIKANRIFRNLTQQDLAKMCGATRLTISQVESDKIKTNFGINTISSILNALDSKLSIVDINENKNQINDNYIYKNKRCKRKSLISREKE